MAKDYGIGQQIEEQEIDVYVPEYDVTVRATPAVSANVINNLAKMKVNGGQKGFNNVGGFEGTSVGDAIRSYVKRVSEEKSDLEPSWWSAYKGAWEGQIKGMARFPMDITAQVYDLYTSGANYMTEALYQNELKTKKQDLDYYNKRLNELENPSDRVKYQMYGDMQNTEDFEEKKQKSIKDYKEKIQSLQKEVENLESDNFRKYLLETQKERKKASDAYAEKIDEIVGMPKNDIASGMESVVTSLLLAPAGAVGLATTYGAAGAGDLLTEMKEQGVDNEKAFGWSTLGGILIGLANTIGDKFILTKAIENITAKSGLMAILKGATAGGTGEFIEEGSESLVTDIVKELSGIGDKSAGQVVVDAVLSGLLGFASGFVFGAGSSGVELKWKKEEYAKNVEKFKQAGISPETSEKIAQVIYDAQDANAMREEIAQLVTEDIDPSKYKDGDMQKDIDETVAILPEMMNRFLTQNEIEIPKAEVEKDENGKEKPLPEEKPVYTISGVDVSKDTMPQLHNLLYQAEASGNPITNIADALQRIDEVSGMKAKRKMRQQFEKVQKDIGKRLQARFGEAYGRSIGQLAAANIYAGAKLNGMSFDEYYKTMFPKINMNLKAVEELTETDNIPFQSERINTRIEKGGKRKEEQVKPIVEFNAVTFEDPENKENVKKAFLKNGFTEKAADDAIENLQRVVDFAKQLGEESERLREQNERKAYIEQRPTEDVAKYEPEEMSLVVQGDKMALGLVPRVSVFVKNGEYQYNIDFGTTCTRREPLEAAIRVMIDMGQAKNLGLSQINNIKDILGKYGFTKPCVLCFVEGKRTYELISANRLSRQWNVVLNSLGIDDGKVIGTERTMSEELLKRLKEMESGKGYEKYVDKQYRDKSDKDPVGLTKARAKAIAKIMLSEFEIPELKDLMTEHRVIRMQGENIQKAILKLVDMLPDEALDLDNQTREDWKDWFRNATGRKVYGTLARMSGFDVEREQAKAFRWASKQLESVGIKGIYYEGGLDGEGVVIFNKEDTRHIRRLLQENGQVVRGAYDQDTNMMYLFETANRSTFLHEMAHAWMNIVINGKTEQAKAVKKAIDEFVGNKGEPYTREQLEKFARGFEQYCSEGVAPNNFLKNAFRNFKNWLISLWKTAKGTGVELNDEIRQVYKDMLGGNDVDAVFSDDMDFKEIEDMVAKIEEYEAKQKEERAKLVLEMAEKIRPESSWANVKDWGNNLLESAGDLPKDILQSSYERLAKIDRKLGLLIQRAEQSQGLRIKRWTEQIKPFYEAFNNLSAEDKAKVQFYLLNQQWGAVEALIGQENTDAVRRMLKTIYDELIASGVEVGYRSNYFPRSVLDYDGLLQEMGLTYPQIRKEMEEAIGKDATPEEQAEWFDKHIMGFSGGNVSTKGNKYTKERKLDLITDKMAQYYRPSMETLINYVEGMAKLLSMREVFGKDYNSKESVGDAIERLLDSKKLSKKEIEEIRKVLSALYLPNGMGNKFLQAMRQYGYATKLSYSTTIRQFADIGMMMKVNGVLNTLDALFHPDKRITLENLGIDPLGEEFNTSKKDIGGKIANIATKWKGINWADAIMKNTYLRGSYKALQDLAKTPEKFHEKYDSLFGDETDTLIKDLNDNKISEPVKVLLFHEISKIQPISRSAMPTAYLSNPNGRVFYMFKTFSLHRAEYMVSELANDFRNGDYKKAGKDIMADVAVIGWEGLVELLIAFLKYGWQAFATKEVLDTFAGAGLGVIGLNKHQALQLTRGQVDDFFQQMIGLGTPIDDIFDLMRHYDEDDKLLRAFLPDMILEPLIAGPKQIGKKKKKVK